MNKTKRHTTFRTSVGTKVYVEAPEVYITPGIKPEDLQAVWQNGGAGREALREELDVHSYIASTRIIREGLDAHFISARWELDGSLSLVNVSDYWRIISTDRREDGEYKCPATCREIETLTKRAFRYPICVVNTRLPALAENMNKVDFGLENTSMEATGTFQFMYWRYGDANHLYVYAASMQGINQALLDFALPADAETKIHSYVIKANKPFGEYYIDRVLRAVAINSPNLEFSTINGPPYTIFPVPAECTPILCGHFEVYSYGHGEVIFPLNPVNVYISDGDPLPPKVFKLYQSGTDTLLAGLSVNPNVTSHPVPVLGYRDKTVYLRADGAGTVRIEILTQADNWREYFSDTISANELWYLKVTGDATLMRVYFEPTSPPATITDAEVVLSG